MMIVLAAFLEAMWLTLAPLVMAIAVAKFMMAPKVSAT